MPHFYKKQLVVRVQEGIERSHDLVNRVSDPAARQVISDLRTQLDHHLFDLTRLDDDDSPDDDEFVLELRSGPNPPPFHMPPRLDFQSAEHLKSLMEIVDHAQQYSQWTQKRKRP